MLRGADTLLRCGKLVWDIRRRGCIHTYKGHAAGVQSVAFSPDGRWVASGDEQGGVRLWDLTAGRLLAELPGHRGAVSSVRFHPNEFLLATGAADRTVRLWDLETFTEVAECGPDAAPVSTIAFTPDGSALLAAAGDALKVWGWEPAKCHDAVAAGWYRACDAVVHAGGGGEAPPRLLGAGCSGSFVGVWAVDLSRVQPFGVADGPDCAPEREAVRAVPQPQRPAAEAATRAALPQTKADAAAERLNALRVNGGGGGGEGVAPRRRGAPAMLEPITRAQPEPTVVPTVVAVAPKKATTVTPSTKAPQAPSTAPGSVLEAAAVAKQSVGVVTGDSLLQGDLGGAIAEARAMHSAAQATVETATASADAEALTQVCGGHTSLAAALTVRLTAVRAASTFAARGELAAAARALTRAGEVSAAADVVPALAADARLNLEAANALLPLCAALLAEREGAGALRCAGAGATAASKLLTAFGSTVRDTALRAAAENAQAAANARRGTGGGIGLDLGFEDRAKRARVTLEAFRALAPHARRLASRQELTAPRPRSDGLAGRALGVSVAEEEEKREVAASAAALLDALERSLGVDA